MRNVLRNTILLNIFRLILEMAPWKRTMSKPRGTLDYTRRFICLESFKKAVRKKRLQTTGDFGFRAKKLYP